MRFPSLSVSDDVFYLFLQKQKNCLTPYTLSSLIRRTLEFHHINDLVGPINYDRIRPPSSKDDFVLWICAIPFHLLVVLQFFIIVSFFRCIVRDGQTSPHRPWLVDPHSICPPLFPSPHANSFVIGTAVINTRTHTDVVLSHCPRLTPFSVISSLIRQYA